MITKSKLFISKGIHSLFQKGFFHLLTALVVGQGFAFILKLILGRWLTNEDFSRYNFIIETNTLLATFMTLALPTAMMRFGIKENKLEYYFGGSIRLFIGLSFIVLTIFYFIKLQKNFFNDAVTNYFLWYTVLLAPSFAFFNYITAFLSSAKKAKERGWLVLGQRISYFVFLIAGCKVALWGGTIIGYTLFSVFLMLFLILKYKKQIFVSCQGFPYKRILTFTIWDSIHKIGAAIIPYLILPFSQQILGNLTQVSYYTMAFSFVVIAKFSFASINDLIFPYLAEKTNKNDFIHFLGKVLLIMGIIALGVIVVSYIIVPFIITFLFGVKYMGAIPIFKLIILGEVVIGVSILFEMILEILGIVRFKAWSILINLAIFIVTIPFLLQNYGIFGAAYSFILFSIIRIAFNTVGVLIYINKLKIN